MRNWLCAVACFCALYVYAGTDTNATKVILVMGAAGESEFGSNFVQQVQTWKQTCQQSGVEVAEIGTSEVKEPSDHDRLKQLLGAEPKSGAAALWLVLIGHGTFDGREARLNLRGPDVSATELAEWLKPFQRTLVVINTTASSAPFIPKLSGTNRVVVAATRAGSEQNFARFGQFIAQSISETHSDLDNDGQTSVLEAFLSAAAHVTDYYKTEGRLATEHALIDDNADGKGTPADWYRGVHAIKKAQNGVLLDGARAHQICLVPSAAEKSLAPETRARRDALELEVVKLRENKSKLTEADYYSQLENLLLELARLQATNSSSR